MNQELLTYFQRELEFLATDAVEFARRHPESAGLVDPEAGPGADPHVERFIDGFALLNAGLQQQLDGQQPDVASALLTSLFPHVQRPLPSMAVVRLDPSESETMAGPVPGGTELVSEPHQGVICHFQTCFPVTPVPLRVQSAALLPSDSSLPGQQLVAEAGAVLRLVLTPTSGSSVRLPTDSRLRLFLQGGSQTAFPLYEALMDHVTGLVGYSRSSGDIRELAGANRIHPVGFDRSETALPWPARSADASRVLTEFFHFPQKFLFVDLPSWQELFPTSSVDETGVELLVCFDEVPRSLETQISAETFQLNCTPVVNAFERRAEPVRLTHDQSEYRLTGDIRTEDGVEILSVDQVTAVSDETSMGVREFFAPAADHDSATATSGPFWRCRRRAGRSGITELWLAIADPAGRLMDPQTWTLDLKATCTNGNRPAGLPWQGSGPKLSMASQSGLEVECIVAPCARRSTSLAESSRWRLGSLLALNCLPLIDEHVGHRRLRETLILHNLNDTPEVVAMIDGLAGAAIENTFEQVFVNRTRSYCQGSLVRIQVDSHRFPGNSSYLFCRVLAEYLARSCSFNSFCRVQVESSETGAVEFTFSAASGEQALGRAESGPPRSQSAPAIPAAT